MALSSWKAEYITAMAAAYQANWLAWLLSDLLDLESGAPEIKVDNKSTIAISKNPVFHDRSKHINTRYHLHPECVEGEGGGGESSSTMFTRRSS